MNIPDRMPVRASKDKIRVQWLTWLCIADAAYGTVNMFGKAESAGQILLRNIWPMPVWGGLMVAGAALIWFGWSVPGGILAGFVWAFTAGASLASIAIGTALSYSGPIPTAFLAGCHSLIIVEVGSGMDKDRERRQRR
jgi:hypothetical protein